MGHTLAKRVRSFRVALRGIAMMLRSEFNARIHALATIVVIVAGLGLRIDRYEWLAVILAITAVWSAEAINTSIEALCDVVTRDDHPGIGRAKDLAAGAVLLTAMGAAVIAAIVFGRRLLVLFAS